jgi:phage terminase Nu1 subunit (DNA packaging protein)
MQLSAVSMQALKAEAYARAHLINRHVAAEILGVTSRTLQRWHRQGIGPQRTNDPRKRPIRYSRAEVEQWASAQKPTA